MHLSTILLTALPVLTSSFELIPAVFTPFTEDGSIDYPKIEPYFTFLKEQQNISTVFISGTNGESLSLSLEERKRLTDEWAQTSSNVIVMVSSESIVDSVELSSYVKTVSETNSNIISVAAMSSSFFKPSTAQDLVDYLKPMAEAAAPLPFRYYHIPSMTGVSIDMIEFQDLVEDQIDTFVGIKYTDTDLFTLRKLILNKGEGVEHFWGKDEILITGIATGATSAVGSTYNFMGRTGYDIVNAFLTADLPSAQSQQDKIVNVVSSWGNLGGIPAQKAIMQMVGMDLGRGVRTPNRALTDEEYDDLEEKLKEVGFFD